MTRKRESEKDESDKPKTKKGEATSKSKSKAVKQQKQWVFITKDGLFGGSGGGQDDSQTSLCKLRHPRMDSGVLFLVSADCQTVCELNCFDEKFHSWFIDEKVHSGNTIYFATPIDPLFLLLPYLINAGQKNKFTELDQIVVDEEFADSQKLLKCSSALDHISQVADCKEIDEDLKVFRYNKDNTLNWLKSKVESLTEVLEQKQINVSAKSSQSSLFVRSKSATASKESYIHYAFGIVGNYLSLELEEELRLFLGIPEIEEKPQVSETAENEPPSKKQKLTAGELKPIDDYSNAVDLKKDKKNVKLTVAQKKLQKTDKTGMKSIASFFSPKSK